MSSAHVCACSGEGGGAVGAHRLILPSDRRQCTPATIASALSVDLCPPPPRRTPPTHQSTCPANPHTLGRRPTSVCHVARVASHGTCHPHSPHPHSSRLVWGGTKEFTSSVHSTNPLLPLGNMYKRIQSYVCPPFHSLSVPSLTPPVPRLHLHTPPAPTAHQSVCLCSTPLLATPRRPCCGAWHLPPPLLPAVVGWHQGVCGRQLGQQHSTHVGTIPRCTCC